MNNNLTENEVNVLLKYLDRITCNGLKEAQELTYLVTKLIEPFNKKRGE